jgi:hypothetical protein
VSRGPGRLGQGIMAEVERPGGIASTDRLREKFPRQTADKSLFRAIRSLERSGAVEIVAEPGSVVGSRVLVLNFGHSEGDNELIRQTKLVLRMVRTIARVRSVPVPALETVPQGPHFEPGRERDRGASHDARSGGPVGG